MPTKWRAFLCNATNFQLFEKSFEKTYKNRCKTCKTPHFTEDEIKSKFIEAYNEAMSDKQRIIDDTKEVITILSDTSEIDKRTLCVVPQ